MTATFRIVRQELARGGGYAFSGTLDQASIDQLPPMMAGVTYLYDQANMPSDVLGHLSTIFRLIEEKNDARG